MSLLSNRPSPKDNCSSVSSSLPVRNTPPSRSIFFESTAIMSSYVYSTDPNPFHQILVISQKTINDSFKNMWELAQLDDEDSPLKHFKERFRSGDYLETDIGVPSVQLQVTTKDPMLYFMLRMTSGKLWLYLTNDPDDDSHIEWPVNDWVFAFSVTISKKEITKDGPEYQQFKERAGLPESNFSLAQLFIDASSTTKWDENLSSFGDREQDFKNLSPDAHATFDTFIQKWLNLMNEKKCNILGYSALRDTDSDLNKYEPTFPPTRIDYDCYPWRSNSYDQDQNNQDTNALCYLMMSNFESPSSKTLSYTGQFIDSSHDATFVMNRSLFWPWMFSVLRDVVVGMIPVPDEPTLYWDNTDPDHPYMGGMGYHFGDWNASSSYYNFTPSGPGRWSWDGRPQYSSKRCQNPNRGNDSETIQQWSNTPDTFDQVFGTDPCGGTLSFDAGSASLTLNGKSRFVFRVDHDTGSRNKYSLMAFTLSWSIGVGMASVEEGGLVFKVTSNSVGVDEKTDGDLSWNPPADEVAREFTDEMGTSIQNAITNVEDRLMNALANQHRLFLPAKGSFLMKDPIFNSKGDLMVKLAYNGADPPKPPPKK